MLQKLFKKRRSRSSKDSAPLKPTRGNDSFPEITQLPEFRDDDLLYKDDDDLSVMSRDKQYDNKEDQDVAVFMALANRMNLDSLLFILQGHARELSLPSADCLLPMNAAKIKAERAAAEAALPEPVIKKFAWAEDAEGNVSSETLEIESHKACKDLWWSDEEMHKILTSAIKDVKYYQENRHTYSNAVHKLATQPDNSQTEGNMKTIINDRHARGLEVHIVGYLENLREEFMDAVLDEQDACEDVGESYETTCYKLREKSLAFSTQSASFARKLAKCDHIVALKASLSKWEKPQPRRRLPKRCGSGFKTSCAGITTEL